MERERIALWAPVALGTGIIAWFWLPDGRYWLGWIALCCLTAMAASVIGQGKRLAMMIITGTLLAALGCAIVWAKALGLGKPPLQRPVFASVEGRIAAVERQPALGRVRLVITPSTPGLPSHIRVNVDKAELPDEAREGATLRFRARLMPPAPPAVPGAYDFAQRAYFMGIGATGKALAPIAVTESAGRSTSGIRQRLVDHISARADEESQGIATVLATGDRGTISREDEAAMRNSGLAHLLSISGLHVSALIGAVIFLTYRLLALWPRLALTLPLMLISAGVGAVAGIGYTLLTGAEVPTVRSCIAALLVLGGLALGREAISLRLVAAGAFLVLLLWPESLLGPSFQMSFAAVTVIIALAEAKWFRELTLRRDEPLAIRWGRGLIALFVVGVAIEFALMPVAMHHFHQAGLLGAFANVVAIPLTTFVIMPAEALALLFDLAGAGAPFWWIVGKAIGVLLTLAHAVSAHPWATWALPVSSGGSFLLLVTGGLWLLLWQTRVRYIGLGMVLAGGVLMAATPSPDLLVTGDGRHLAVRQADGRLALLRGRAGDYVRSVFSGAAGDGEFSADNGAMGALADAGNARCSRDICSILVRKPERDWLIVATRSNVRVPWQALVEMCARADIVVSDRRLPAACVPRWLKLDRARLSESGGVAVYLESKSWRGVKSPDDLHPWVGGRRREAVPAARSASAQL